MHGNVIELEPETANFSHQTSIDFEILVAHGRVLELESLFAMKSDSKYQLCTVVALRKESGIAAL